MAQRRNEPRRADGRHEIPIARREFANILAAAGVMLPFSATLDSAPERAVSKEDVRIASTLAGEQVPPARIEVLAKTFESKLEEFRPVREFEMSDDTEPAPIFVVDSGETVG